MKKDVSFHTGSGGRHVNLSELCFKVSTVSGSATLLFVAQQLTNYLLSSHTNNWSFLAPFV